jgi:imidazolonepropionase-like amidohydrolase
LNSLSSRARGLLLAAALGIPRAAPAQDIAITHVNVVDVRSGALQRDRLVVLHGDRIAAVEPGAARVPAGARIVDGRGRFLIPGLWDMHVHVANQRRGLQESAPDGSRRYAFDLLLANGVTGVREMADDLALAVAWRDSIAAGTLEGPRMLVTGERMGDHAVVQGAPFPVEDAADVRRSVQLLHDGHANHVKVGDLLPPELLADVGAAARDAGLPLVGHVPVGASAGDAVRAGYRSIEHLQSIVNAGSPRERELLAGQLDAQPPRSWWRRLWRRCCERNVPYPEPAPDEIQPQRITDLGAQMAAAGTWMTPTLRSMGTILRAKDSLLALGPIAYRLDTVFNDSSWAVRNQPKRLDRMWSMMFRSVSLLRQGGVHFLAGSDFPKPETMPGFGLHDELGLLVEAGLTPAEALRAATLEPAAYLGATDSMGTVEAGRVADLVLLDANPLDAIANTRRLRAVIVRGKLLDRAALDAFLAESARLAAQARQRNTS